MFRSFCSSEQTFTNYCLQTQATICSLPQLSNSQGFAKLQTKLKAIWNDNAFERGRKVHVIRREDGVHAHDKPILKAESICLVIERIMISPGLLFCSVRRKNAYRFKNQNSLFLQHTRMKQISTKMNPEFHLGGTRTAWRSETQNMSLQRMQAVHLRNTSRLNQKVTS